MKKKIGICIVVIVTVAILVVVGLELYSGQATDMIHDLVYEEVRGVKVIANPPGKEAQLGADEVQELLEILDMVKVYKKDNSYGEYAGQWVEFEIIQTDGRVIEVAAYAPFIIIDGIGYQADYEACQRMNGLANRVIDVAPVNLEQDESEIMIAGRMVRVKGKLYYDSGMLSDTLRCGVMDGQIETTVEAGEVPKKDNQSNFGAGYGYQYGAGGTIEINVDGKWLIFEEGND